MASEHINIVVEHMDGETKHLCVDRENGAVADEGGIVRFYRTDNYRDDDYLVTHRSTRLRLELYAAPAVNLRGWG